MFKDILTKRISHKTIDVGFSLVLVGFHMRDTSPDNATLAVLVINALRSPLGARYWFNLARANANALDGFEPAKFIATWFGVPITPRIIKSASTTDAKVCICGRKIRSLKSVMFNSFFFGTKLQCNVFLGVKRQVDFIFYHVSA